MIVALLYVTVVSFGLAGLLGNISAALRKGNGIELAPVHMHWILILLVVHFNMAWHAVYITNITDWHYYGFLFIVLGPIIAFFAANAVAPAPLPDTSTEALMKQYWDMKPILVRLFIILQCWTIGADLMLNRGFTGSGILNGLLLLIALALNFSNEKKVHQFGIGGIWLVYVVAIVLRSLGTID